MTRYDGLFFVTIPGILVQECPVPLKSVRAHATILDTVARVTLTQVYVNQYALVPLEAAYRFPLPENAAVCGFEARIDDRLVRGEVQEKQEARETYETAVSQGKTAFLLEQKTTEIFLITVGNIPPGSTIEVKTTFVMDLKCEIDDSVRFVLPTFIAPRYQPIGDLSVNHFASYSSPREVQVASVVPNSPYFFQLQVECRMTTRIVSFMSPSHAIAPQSEAVWIYSTWPAPATVVAAAPAAQMTFNFREVYMDKDIILLVKAENMDRPRVVIEKHVDAESYCGMLTFIPKFQLDEVRSELIFVIDRSGSMGGAKINAARKAMLLMLKSLPEDSFFNIYSFGDRYSALFPTSVRYDQVTLQRGLELVQKMDADFGGTELLDPIRSIFKSAKPDGKNGSLKGDVSNEVSPYKRQIFVLTDGEISNTEQVIHEITKNANTARVFTLGIGNAVSHELVEGMARAGRGDAQYVDDNVDAAKLIAQLQRATQPEMRDLKVHWTKNSSSSSSIAASQPPSAPAAAAPAAAPEPEKPKSKLSFWNPAAFAKPAPAKDNALPIPEPDLESSVQMAPYMPPPIYPGTRFLSFALFKDKSDIPKTIRITAQSPEGPIDLEVPTVTEHTPIPVVPAPGMPSLLGERLHDYIEGTIIHTLAARATIRDMENGVSYLHGIRKVKVTEEQVKAEIVRLGKAFGLTSKHTSYVAVDESTRVARPVLLFDRPVVAVAQPQNMYRSRMVNLSSSAHPPAMMSMPMMSGPAPAPAYEFARSSVNDAADHRKAKKSSGFGSAFASTLGSAFGSSSASSAGGFSRPRGGGAPPTFSSSSAASNVPPPPAYQSASMPLPPPPAMSQPYFEAVASSFAPPPLAYRKKEVQEDEDEDDCDMAFTDLDDLPSLRNAAYRNKKVQEDEDEDDCDMAVPDCDHQPSHFNAAPLAMEQAAPSAALVANEASLLALIELQAFDGSFEFDAKLQRMAAGLFGVADESKLAQWTAAAAAATATATVTAQMWATALAVVVLEKFFGHLSDQWMLVANKARKNLGKQGLSAGDVAALLQAALSWIEGLKN